MRVLVVGAGVVGLSCAVRLAEAGYDTHVLARDLPLETTSAVAAALWYPYRAGTGDRRDSERVTAWAGATYAEWARLAAQEPAAGVRLRPGRELLRSPAPQPWWAPAVPGLAPLHPDRVPPGYSGGWALTLPVADTSRHLPWLAARLATAGGTLTRTWLTGLPAAPLVVNATGLAAAALCADPSVTPVRGQVVYVEQTGVEEWTLDQSDPAAPVYVVPRERDVVVGGTAVPGDRDLRPDRAAAAAVLERAAALVPALRGARVLGHRVGLRPVRPGVRLETERRRDGGTVVHCYGHGGAGATLGWGCAGDVLAEVRSLSAP